MTQENHIKKISTPSSYDLLLKEGIASIQELAGSIWTDYNEHDPGVTILESICYALTDILNKINVPLENIICDVKGNLPLASNALYTARNIMHVSPVTEKDLCKFIIDQSTSIRNAWIEPYFVNINETHIGVFGLYQVFIDFKNSLNKGNDIIIEQLAKTLNDSRNIAEFFPISGIKIATPISHRVEFQLIVDENEYVESVVANILFFIQIFFRPEIKTYSYSDLKKQGYSTEEIFDGPRLNNGFILDKDIKKPINSIDYDLLIAKIGNIKGVKSIDNFNIIQLQDTSLLKPNEIVFDLDFIDSIKNIKVQKKQKEYVFEAALVQANLNDLISDNSKSFRTNYKIEDLDIVVKSNHQIKVGDYFSIQNEFPRIYGIGKNKFSNGTSNQKKANALQLKGYLMLFEQLLSDISVQLQHVKELFSINEQRVTYFHAPLYNVPDGASLLKGFNLDPNYIYDSQNGDVYLNYTNNFVRNHENEFELTLNKLYEGYDKFVDRRNEFLDHLLSRFNFTSVDIPALLYSSPTKDMQQYSIEIKQLLLKNINEITANRNRYSWGESSEIYSFDPIFLKLIYFHTIAGLPYNKVTDSINNELKHIVIINEPLEQLTKDKIYLETEIDNFNEIVTATFNTKNISIRNNGFKNEIVVKFNNKEIYSAEINDIEKYEPAKILISEIQYDFQVIFTEMSKLFIIDNMSLLPNTDNNNFSIFNKNNIGSNSLLIGKSYRDSFNQIINPTEEVELAVKVGKYWISQNFFSPMMTIVLAEQNSNSDNKAAMLKFIEEMLTANLPAHVSLQILSLNNDNLINFKKNYNDWVCNKDENSSINLVNFLVSQPDYKKYLING